MTPYFVVFSEYSINIGNHLIHIEHIDIVPVLFLTITMSVVIWRNIIIQLSLS